MDIAAIKTSVNSYLETVDHTNVDWTQVVTDVRQLIINDADDLNDFNVKIGKDTGKKYNLEIVIPMVFKL